MVLFVANVGPVAFVIFLDFFVLWGDDFLVEDWPHEDSRSSATPFVTFVGVDFIGFCYAFRELNTHKVSMFNFG